MVATSVGRARQGASIGTATLDTPFRVASLTKLVTAATVVRAAQRTGLALDAPAIEVLSHLRGDWAADRRLTIAQVLSQTSGLASTVTSDDVRRLGEDDAALTEAARLVVRAGSARAPGNRWECYNGNYFLAGAIVAALTGTTFEAALDDLVLRPWGMTSSTFSVPSDLAPGVDADPRVGAANYPRARRPSGGLIATAADLLTFGEGLLDDVDLLAAVRAQRTRPGDPMRYALGWALGPSGQMFLNGRLPGYRSALLVVPEQGLVALALAADSRALPALARIMSDLQQGLTGDDLTAAIDGFAA